MTADEFIMELEKIIRRESIIDLRGSITLIEETEGAKCREVAINKKGKCIVMRFNGQNAFPYFTDVEGLKIMCDYIIVTISPHDDKRERKVVIMLCELKSRREGDARKQLIAGKIFSEFLVKTLGRVKLKGDLPEIKYGYVIFTSNRAVRKGLTLPGTQINENVGGIPLLPLQCRRDDGKKHDLGEITARLLH